MSRDALIVGISSYQYLPRLKAPSVDAEAITQNLAQNSDFKIHRMPEHIEQAEDGKKPAISAKQAVSQSQLKQALKQLFLPDGQQIPETALFYFSGHGLADEEGYDRGYLATSEAMPDHPSTGLSLRWLHWLLSESPIKQQIIWLDCCHSGSLIVNMEAANPGSGSNRNRCFIASSRDFESSWEDLNSPYSVLTKALLEGLNPTRLPGNSVNSSDLVAYINRALKGELQTPVCTYSGEPIDLTRNWQVAQPKAETTQADSGICPYKGLEFFDCNDEDPKYFFGRERLIGHLIDHVIAKPFLALVGASGNGKSSVLRAGLLHQLKLGDRVAGSEQWQILVTRPDAQPMKNLAAAFVPETGTQLDRAIALEKAERLLKAGSAGLQRLVQASSAPRTLLVIDQFEEVFTRCDREEARLQFFETLMGALAEAKDKLCLIIAMRADFVGRCLAQDYAGLAQQVQENMISVLPLAEDELRTAICKPAEKAGLLVEPALVSAIVRDTKDAPGSLPLLQYTLKELWQRRANGKLNIADYQQLGGIEGTLNKRATEVYDSFDEAQQQTVQHIFQQLTQLGEGAEDTRRRVFLDNLIAEPLHPKQQVQAVVETLSSPDNRLLVTNEVVGKGSTAEHRAIVDVSHEALIRHWKLLQQWIEQDRNLLRQQRRIETSMVAWQENAQAPGYLLQGISLAETIQFRAQQADTFPLSNIAKRFVEKSVERQYWNRVRTASWLIVPATLIVGLVEYSVRETRIKSDYLSLASSSRSEQRQAVEDLVEGCREQKLFSDISRYFVERRFGNCRSLTSADLSGAFLADADLTNADLTNADLTNADLSGANLSGANLWRANLTDAKLNNVNLKNNASLIGANLSGAKLTDAKLNNASLSYADLGRADLSYADLGRADLTGADLTGADLAGAFLNNADFSSANLTGVNFTGANLTGADLRNTELTSADFNSANLFSSILLSTDLRPALYLTKQQLQGKNRPFICNSPLLSDLGIEGGMDRDCDRIAEYLMKKYPGRFETLTEAEERIADLRREEWD